MVARVNIGDFLKSLSMIQILHSTIPFPEDLSDPEAEPGSPALQVDSLYRLSPQGNT